MWQALDGPVPSGRDPGHRPTDCASWAPARCRLAQPSRFEPTVFMWQGPRWPSASGCDSTDRWRKLGSGSGSSGSPLALRARLRTLKWQGPRERDSDSMLALRPAGPCPLARAIARSPRLRVWLQGSVSSSGPAEPRLNCGRASQLGGRGSKV
jgi:hypothetical protein